MKFFNKFFLPAVAISMLAASCEKQLDIAPRQSIDAANALNTADNLDAAITGIYVRLKSARWYGRDVQLLPDALADNGYANNRSGRFLPESINQYGSHFTGTIFSSGYAGINQINLCLEAVPGISTASAAQKARWEGQLYFLRGLFYFDLARVYAYIPGAVVPSQDRGGVPLTTTGIATAEGALATKLPRASITAVYDQIVADLQLANTRLTNGVSVATANKAAAQLLLARVSLYRKNYADAKRWSDSVITQVGGAGRFATTGNYVNQWRGDTHLETLFQVRFATAAESIGVNESTQTSLTTLGQPGGTTTVGFGDLVPTPTLLADLGITLNGGSAGFTTLPAVITARSTDVRNQLYEVGTAGRGKAYVECTKYIGKNGAANLDNSPVLRFSEAYLIRAEAQISTGSTVLNEANARTDLKALKANRYTDYTGSAVETADNALTGNALLEEIIRQRRIEFAFEGYRFFDFKRLGRDITKSPSNAFFPFTDIRVLPAIPQAEIDVNPNVVQNAGY